MKETDCGCRGRRYVKRSLLQQGLNVVDSKAGQDYYMEWCLGKHKEASLHLLASLRGRVESVIGH